MATMVLTFQEHICRLSARKTDTHILLSCSKVGYYPLDSLLAILGYEESKLPRELLSVV